MSVETLIQDAAGGQPIKLSYSVKSPVGLQARFRGRYALTPDIDLHSYETRAVIDWIELQISLEKPSQAKWVREIITEALGKNCYAKLIDGFPTGTDFTIRIQEPTISELEKCEKALSDWHGLRGCPTIAAIEVSIDFRPREHSRKALARMFSVLVRHHLPYRDVMSNLEDRPRFVWGAEKRLTQHVARVGRDKELHALDPQTDHPAIFGSTYYVGQKSGSSFWRTMLKALDQQNPSAGTKVELPPSEHRIRLEVQIRDEELKKLGLHEWTDLRSFKFATLQKPYFMMRLPTFRQSPASASSTMKIIIEKIQNIRTIKFLRSGVLGLKELDEQMRKHDKQIRKGMKLRLNRKLRPVRRSGTGENMSLADYRDMSDRIAAALSNLGKRVNS